MYVHYRTFTFNTHQCSQAVLTQDVHVHLFVQFPSTRDINLNPRNSFNYISSFMPNPIHPTKTLSAFPSFESKRFWIEYFSYFTGNSSTPITYSPFIGNAFKQKTVLHIQTIPRQWKILPILCRGNTSSNFLLLYLENSLTATLTSINLKPLKTASRLPLPKKMVHYVFQVLGFWGVPIPNQFIV